MNRSKKQINQQLAEGILFQSLFSWMNRSKVKKDNAIAAYDGFNPCSRG